MTVDWKKHIASDPEILRRKPRLKATRIPVGVVLGYLAARKNAEEIIAELPHLTRRADRGMFGTTPANWLHLKPSSDGPAVSGGPLHLN